MSLNRQIADRLEREARACESPRDRGDLLARWSASTGISKGILARELKARRVPVTRRSEGGRKSTHGLSGDQLDKVLGNVQRTRRKTGMKIMGLETAIRAAELQGVIPEGSLSYSQARTHMKKSGLLIRQILAPPPTHQLRSAHPNLMHQFDFSVCLIVKPPSAKKQMKILSMSVDLEKNKIQEELASGSERIWRALTVDHYSGAFHLRYFLLKGESAVATIEALEDAWLPKSNPALLFHGLPEILLVDKGPGNNSEFMQNLCRNYDVDLRMHTPGRPWAKGSVETHHNLVQQKFESMLALNPPWSVEEINQRADDFTADYNATRVLTRNGLKVAPRYELWSHIQPGELRVPSSSAEFRASASRSVQVRSVGWEGNFTVSVEKSEMTPFRLPADLRENYGAKVHVVVNPFTWRDSHSVLVSRDGESPWYLAQNIAVDRAGRFATAKSVRHPQRHIINAAERFRRAADEAQMPPARIEELSPLERREIAARFDIPMAASVDPNYAPALPTFDAYDARDMVRAALPNMSMTQRGLVNEWINDPLTQSQIDEVIARIRLSGDSTISAAG